MNENSWLLPDELWHPNELFKFAPKSLLNCLKEYGLPITILDINPIDIYNSLCSYHEKSRNFSVESLRKHGFNEGVILNLCRGIQFIEISILERYNQLSLEDVDFRFFSYTPNFVDKNKTDLRNTLQKSKLIFQLLRLNLANSGAYSEAIALIPSLPSLEDYNSLYGAKSKESLDKTLSMIHELAGLEKRLDENELGNLFELIHIYKAVLNLVQNKLFNEAFVNCWTGEASIWENLYFIYDSKSRDFSKQSF